MAELSGVPLDQAAQRLLAVTQQQQQQQQGSLPPSQPGAAAADDITQVLDVAAATTAAAAAAAPPAAPSAAQLRTLFELWDRQGDGFINFNELCLGLSKMRQPIKHKKVRPQQLRCWVAAPAAAVCSTSAALCLIYGVYTSKHTA